VRGEGQGLRVVSEIKEFVRRKKFRSHMLATDVRWRLGKNTWDQYFKFTIERNPWDKVVSDYFWAQRHPENQIPFEQWIKEDRWSGSHFHFYTIGGKVAMDRILRYETLASDFKALLEHLGVENPVELPQAKAGFRKNNVHYRDVHTAYTRARVMEEFRREIGHFGYEF
jgi:hypothetical protein